MPGEQNESIENEGVRKQSKDARARQEHAQHFCSPHLPTATRPSHVKAKVRRHQLKGCHVHILAEPQPDLPITAMHRVKE